MTKIRAFITGWNHRKHPFIWTKTPDQILAKIKRVERPRIAAALGEGQRGDRLRGETGCVAAGRFSRRLDRCRLTTVLSRCLAASLKLCQGIDQNQRNQQNEPFGKETPMSPDTKALDGTPPCGCRRARRSRAEDGLARRQRRAERLRRDEGAGRAGHRRPRVRAEPRRRVAAARGRSDPDDRADPRAVDNPFSAAINRAVEIVAAARGTAVFAASSDDDTDRERELVAAFNRRRVDGLIITAYGPDQGYLQSVRERGTPLVFVDRVPRGLLADVALTDNVGWAAVATEHLIDHGHRRIALLERRCEHPDRPGPSATATNRPWPPPASRCRRLQRGRPHHRRAGGGRGRATDRAARIRRRR